MEKINPLTGLYFGHAYFSEVEEFLKTAEQTDYCMMAIDVEHFRLYNQLHGKEEGDHLLVIIANMLRKFQKEYGGVVGYLGGDNFAIVTKYDKDLL